MTVDSVPRSTATLDNARIRHFLEQQLEERRAIIRESEPSAAPNTDPVSWATNEAARRVMDQISAALDRLQAGTYGRCVRCGGAIVVARLDAVPYAENCVDCQLDVDKR